MTNARTASGFRLQTSGAKTSARKTGTALFAAMILAMPLLAVVALAMAGWRWLADACDAVRTLWALCQDARNDTGPERLDRWA